MIQGGDPTGTARAVRATARSTCRPPMPSTRRGSSRWRRPAPTAGHLRQPVLRRHRPGRGTAARVRDRRQGDRGLDTVAAIEALGDRRRAAVEARRDREGHGQGELMLAAVVLAAGAAERFGSPKQRLLLPAVLARVRAAQLEESSSWPVRTSSTSRSAPCSVPSGSSARARRSAAASLRYGRRIEAAIVVLADGPELSPGVDRARRGRVARHRRAARRGLVRRLARPPAARRAGALGRRAGRGVARPRAAARPVRRPRRARRRRLPRATCRAEVATARGRWPRRAALSASRSARPASARSRRP